MESDTDTPIPMLQILGRNKSSGTISSLTTTRSTDNDNEEEEEEEEEEDGDKADKADADATSAMISSHNVTQYKAATTARTTLRTGNNNSSSSSSSSNNNSSNSNSNSNINKNNELHVGMQDGYYYKGGTHVEEATTYPKPPQDYSPQTTTRANLENHPGMMLTTLAPGTNSAIDQSLRRALAVGTCTTSFHLDGWAFHYQNWAPEEDIPTFSRRYTSNRDLFPQERKGKLDMAKLRKYGLQLGRVLNNEEDEKQVNDMRQKPFYSKVLKSSNNYANQANTGKGHYVRRTKKLSELVHFDGIKMSWYWWRQIKSILKLNCNHETKYNRLLCKDDTSKFNYAYKFDYIYETLVCNVYYFSKKVIQTEVSRTNACIQSIRYDLSSGCATQRSDPVFNKAKTGAE
eukprot:jgi/Psemu1/38086/gm1.38086_g